MTGPSAVSPAPSPHLFEHPVKLHSPGELGALSTRCPGSGSQPWGPAALAFPVSARCRQCRRTVRVWEGRLGDHEPLPPPPPVLRDPPLRARVLEVLQRHPGRLVSQRFIREQLGVPLGHGTLGATLNLLERQGLVAVDRDERPHLYALVQP